MPNSSLPTRPGVILARSPFDSRGAARAPGRIGAGAVHRARSTSVCGREDGAKRPPAQVALAELGLSRSMLPDTSRCGFGPSSAGTTRKDAQGSATKTEV